MKKRSVFRIIFDLVLAPFVSSLASSPIKKVTFYNSGTCPYAQRAWIALVEKGIEFDLVKVDLQNKSPEFEDAYRKANPNPQCSSKVPVLVVEDGETTHVYTESSVVLEAIEELWPKNPALLPPDAASRAKARLFGSVVYDAAFGGSKSAYQLARRKLDSDTWDEEEEKKSLCESLAALNQCLVQYHKDGGPFVLGEFFSMAECMTAPMVQRFDAIWTHHVGTTVVEVAQSKGYHRAAAWWQAVLERESVVSTGVSPQQAVEGAERIVAMIRARSGK